MNTEINESDEVAITTDPQSLWGPQRHKYIAMQADKRLSDKARKSVSEILASIGQGSLGEIATWADEIKGGGPKDPQTLEFLKAFPNQEHKSWHYVDLPLSVTSYDRVKYAEFTNDRDVVQMAATSVKVLQGKSEFMSKINALRWLAHLIGDIHQPLHVGCTYIDYKAENPTFLTEPGDIVERGLTESSDQGGNAFLLPIDGKVTLHSYWDSKIPSSPPSAEQVLATKVEMPAGPPEKWAEVWAFDAVLKSRIAYQPLKITGKDGKKIKLGWESKEVYDKLCAPIVTEQLALGSERLAGLVNEIFK